MSTTNLGPTPPQRALLERFGHNPDDRQWQERSPGDIAIRIRDLEGERGQWPNRAQQYHKRERLEAITQKGLCVGMRVKIAAGEGAGVIGVISKIDEDWYVFLDRGDPSKKRKFPPHNMEPLP